MTMPSKIYVVMNNPKSIQLARLDKLEAERSKFGNADALTYIRADLAEELAGALESAEKYLQRGHDKMAHNIVRSALARYHAAINP